MSQLSLAALKALWANANPGLKTFLDNIVDSSPNIVTNNILLGGQGDVEAATPADPGTATPLTYQFNVIDAATDFDSAVLAPTAKAGKWFLCMLYGYKEVYVYPSGADEFFYNGDTSTFTLQGNAVALFFCDQDGRWIGINIPQLKMATTVINFRTAQSGTSAPSETDIKNDYGGGFTRTRQAVGIYRYALTGFITSSNTSVVLGGSGGANCYAVVKLGTNDYFEIWTYNATFNALADAVMTDLCVSVEINNADNPN